MAHLVPSICGELELVSLRVQSTSLIFGLSSIFWGLAVIRGSECLLSMSLLTLLSNSSHMAFRISSIVAFVIPPDLFHCLVFTHCVLPVPMLESCDVVVPAPVIPVAMVF